MIALYPGKFDPFHNGHLDIVTRARVLFDEVVVAVYANPDANVLFDSPKRCELAYEATRHLSGVSVLDYRGLTVDCARRVGAGVVVRGLRNLADYEFEFQVGTANRDMAPEVDLCCLFTSSQFSFLSASILKEVAGLHGDFAKWAPPATVAALCTRFDIPEPATSESLALPKSRRSHQD